MPVIKTVGRRSKAQVADREDREDSHEMHTLGEEKIVLESDECIEDQTKANGRFYRWIRTIFKNLTGS
jgi:hypothetical protein